MFILRISKEEWTDRSFLLVFVYYFEPRVIEHIPQLHSLLGVGNQQPTDQVFGLAADGLPLDVVQVVHALDGVVGDVFPELAVKGQEAPQPRCRLRRT